MIALIKFGDPEFLDVRTQKTLRLLRDFGYEVRVITAPRRNRILARARLLRRIVDVLWIYTKTLYVCGSGQVAVLYCCDFECGVVGIVARTLFRVPYVYDIYDEILMRLRRGSVLHRLIVPVEGVALRRAEVVVRVEHYRKPPNEKSVVVRNVPLHSEAMPRVPCRLRRVFAFTGNLTKNRGLDSIKAFATECNWAYIAVFGKMTGELMTSGLLELPNVKYFGRRPQHRVIRFARWCCGVFCLYDPGMEVNVFAASNKFYEGALTKTFAIVNSEIFAAGDLCRAGVGVAVPFKYDARWRDSLNNLHARKFVANGVVAGSFRDEFAVVARILSEVIARRGRTWDV